MNDFIKVILEMIGYVSKRKLPSVKCSRVKTKVEIGGNTENHDSEFAFQWILRLDDL